MNYKKMNQEDILNWCIENNELEWLDAKLAEKTTAEYHTQRVKVWSEEKQKEVWVADKTSPKVTKEIPISFIEVKNAFCEKFMPELLPAKKEEAPSLRDKVKAALAAKKK